MSLRPILSMLAGAALAACSTFGIRSGTEEPRYAVVGHVGTVEIRRYGPRVAAETTVTGPERAALSAGFRRIAGYIFGANHGARRIAMTAPVAQSEARTIAMTAPVAQSPAPGGGWTVRFFMPAAETLESLPEPNDPAVRLVAVPARSYAVLRFSGRPTLESVDAERRRLLAALSGGAWQAAGAPRAWYYDPPWTIPFLRRNEVAVPVVPAAAPP